MGEGHRAAAKRREWVKREEERRKDAVKAHCNANARERGVFRGMGQLIFYVRELRPVCSITLSIINTNTFYYYGQYLHLLLHFVHIFRLNKCWKYINIKKLQGCYHYFICGEYNYCLINPVKASLSELR